MFGQCRIHVIQSEITCLACKVTKTCHEFLAVNSKPSGHRHVCLDCDDLGIKAVPPPPKPRFADYEIRTCESKDRFETRLDALGSCANSVRRGRPLSVYQCPVCRGWHKTSKRLKWAVKPDEVARRDQDVVEKPPGERSA